MLLKTQTGHQGTRYSVEKLISAGATLFGAVTGLALSFGWIEPDGADAILTGVDGFVTRVFRSMDEVWPLLTAFGTLYWRARVRKDDLP